MRRLPHVDLLQRIAVPSALLTITIGSITAGVLVGDFSRLVILSIMCIIAGFAGWAWLESERRRLRVLYGQVCEFERSKKSAGEAFTMEAWVDDLKDRVPWGGVARRVLLCGDGDYAVSAVGLSITSPVSAVGVGVVGSGVGAGGVSRAMEASERQ